MADSNAKTATLSNGDEVRLATEEENRADALAAAPEKDELQRKREEVAAAGLAHGSLNGYQPSEAEAAIAGKPDADDTDGSDQGEEAGNATEGTALSKQNKTELRATAEAEGVEVNDDMTVAQLREAIEAKRAES